jgi:predicted metal-dependent hydrolase
MFLSRNADWVLDQLRRAERLGNVRRLRERRAGEMLFRGELARVRIEKAGTRSRASSIVFANGQIVIRRGGAARTAVARTLERWLRREARGEIEHHLAPVMARLRCEPGRVYVMGQRTKWGNCSAKGNLSFNWRLILAPDFVLRYMVTHEAVHLAIPDHSAKFWLTVQSLCPEMERAKHWLFSHQAQLTVDLETVLDGASVSRPVAGQ